MRGCFWCFLFLFEFFAVNSFTYIFVIKLLSSYVCACTIYGEAWTFVRVLHTVCRIIEERTKDTLSGWKQAVKVGRICYLRLDYVPTDNIFQ